MKPLLLLGFMLLCAGKIGAQTNRSRAILVYSESFSMQTFVRVTCEAFNEHLGSTMMNKVTNRDSIARFDKLLQKVKYAKKDRPLDVRATVVYTGKNGKTIAICIDRSGATINGKLIEEKQPVLAFLYSLIPKENQLPGKGIIQK